MKLEFDANPEQLIAKFRPLCMPMQPILFDPPDVVELFYYVAIVHRNRVGMWNKAMLASDRFNETFVTMVFRRYCNIIQYCMNDDSYWMRMRSLHMGEADRLAEKLFGVEGKEKCIRWRNKTSEIEKNAIMQQLLEEGHRQKIREIEEHEMSHIYKAELSSHLQIKWPAYYEKDEQRKHK